MRPGWRGAWGCVTTPAAGNNSSDVKYSFPANLQDVITVAASGADDSKASFSNWGYLVDVAAPGGGPDAASPSAAHRNILSLRAGGTGDQSLIVGGSYLRQAGTSMATPHVSGVVALLPSANPQLTVAQVESITRHTARDEVGDPSLDTAGYDPYYGWGRLDAAAAVARAFDLPADPPILKVLAESLEFDVPAAMCAGQQGSLPVGVYNLGGGTMSWSAVAPDWLTVVSSSVTTPSFPSVTMTRIADATGVLTIRSPEDPDGSAAMPVIARVASDITISNCSAVLSRASSNQVWIRSTTSARRPPEPRTAPGARSTCGPTRGTATQICSCSGWTAREPALERGRDGVDLRLAGSRDPPRDRRRRNGRRDHRLGRGRQHGRYLRQAHPGPEGNRLRRRSSGGRRRLKWPPEDRRGRPSSPKAGGGSDRRLDGLSQRQFGHLRAADRRERNGLGADRRSAGDAGDRCPVRHRDGDGRLRRRDPDLGR